MRLILSANSINTFNRCREEWRQTYIEQRASAYIAVHREAGIAIHKGVEGLWHGYSFEYILPDVMRHFAMIPEDRILAADKRKWEELKAMAPTMLATYADTVDISPEKLQMVPPLLQLTPSGDFNGHTTMLEYEWQGPFLGVADVLLTGRIDRVEVGPHLVDVKTASEMDGTDEYGKKVGWEKSYRAQMAKDLGLGLYDWYLRSVGLAPGMVSLEVILKPNDRYGRKCRVVRMEMPEVLAYRERFDAELEFTLREIRQYVLNYAKMQPWPMNRKACTEGKFGNCHLLASCNLGLNPRTERLYRQREEHLSIKGRRIEL